MHSDPSKRQALGSQVGAKPLINEKSAVFVVDVLRRRDRGNEGFSNIEAASMVVDLHPELTSRQVHLHLRIRIALPQCIHIASLWCVVPSRSFLDFAFPDCAAWSSQASGALRKTIRPTFSKVLTNIVKAQASTSKRSAVTVPQQYRWHTVCNRSL